MEASGLCYCPICLRELSGRLVLDEHVWLSRQCPEHGLVQTMLFDEPSFFTSAMNVAAASRLAPGRTALVAEVTERCDVGCATCSASSTMTGDDRDAGSLVTSILERAGSTGADVIALSGGEPLMRADIWDIIDALHRTIPKLVIITSGRGLESSPALLDAIAARADWLEIYLQFDSLRDEVLTALRTPAMTAALRRERLRLTTGTGAATTAVCVIPPDSSAQEVGALARFCRDANAAGVTFQPLRGLGRYPPNGIVTGPMVTIDHIQACALEALGVACPEPRPFAQQPFDMTVAFVSGTEAVTSDRFFLVERHDGGFRVATSSYWDFANYFGPMASRMPCYFHVADGQSLNAHYFAATLSARKPTAVCGPPQEIRPARVS